MRCRSAHRLSGRPIDDLTPPAMGPVGVYSGRNFVALMRSLRRDTTSRNSPMQVGTQSDNLSGGVGFDSAAGMFRSPFLNYCPSAVREGILRSSHCQSRRP
jgi:hypothetical protein